MAPGSSVVAQLERSWESRLLELEYEKGKHDVEAICANEKERAYRLRERLLEIEIDELQEELACSDSRAEDMGSRLQEIASTLEVTQSNLESARTEVRIKLREVETLKAELSCLQGVTMESTRLLTEKLTLSRELSSLKPELESLRSQAASHQSLLAEKLSLQRHVKTLQVELENEKRLTKRTAQKEHASIEASAKLESQNEKLHTEMNKERREWQKKDREDQMKTMNLENRVTTLESRLDVFRDKLKTTKEQLKEKQVELEEIKATISQPSWKSKSNVGKRNTRKRETSEMDDDMMVGTPGDMPPSKRNKSSTTMVGEKSTFSITPFLNCTANVAPESPPSPGGRTDRPQISGAGLGPETLSMDSETDEQTANAKAPRQEASGTSSNRAGTKAALGRKARAKAGLEQVVEEGPESDAGVVQSEVGNNMTTLGPSTKGPLQAKKAKKKILTGGLGKTLFDEYDADVKGDRPGLGGVTKFSTMKTLGCSGAQSTSTFGAISPLKRDRRPPAV